MSNLTQVGQGGVERPDVTLKEDLDNIKSTAQAAKQTAEETSAFLETRVPIGRTINSLPLDQDIVLDAESLDTYTKEVIDQKLSALEAGGYNPVKVNGHLLDRDVILSAGDVGAYSASETDGKLAGKVNTTVTINGKPLTSNITIGVDDFDAYTKGEIDAKVENLVTKDRTINGKNLSADIIFELSDFGGTSDLVPRTFRINGKEMQGLSLDLVASDIGAISTGYVDDRLANYMPNDNLYGLGLPPMSVTSGSFATKISASGFYEYGPGTVTNEDGSTSPTSVSDRPVGSESGRVIVLSNGSTSDPETGVVVNPAVQDLLAFPNDIDSLWFKKGGSTTWIKVVSLDVLAPYLKTDSSGRLDVPLILKNNVAIRSELAAGDGGKDILKVTGTAVEVGNVGKPLHVNSSGDPAVNIAGTDYKFYTENFPPPGGAGGGLRNVTVLTTSQSYTPSPDAEYIVIEAVGAGGGVAAQNSPNLPRSISGGGSGAYAKMLLTKDNLSSMGGSLSCTVGLGGVGIGGNTTVTNLLTLRGGEAGMGLTPANASSSYTRGRVARGGQAFVSAQSVGKTLALIAGSPGTEASTDGANAYGGTGGSNPLGSGGWPSTTLPGENATAAMFIPSGYGGGAGGRGLASGGAATDAVNGGDGVIIIWEY